MVAESSPTLAIDIRESVVVGSVAPSSSRMDDGVAASGGPARLLGVVDDGDDGSRRPRRSGRRCRSRVAVAPVAVGAVEVELPDASSFAGTNRRRCTRV